MGLFLFFLEKVLGFREKIWTQFETCFFVIYQLKCRLSTTFVLLENMDQAIIEQVKNIEKKVGVSKENFERKKRKKT